MILLSLWATVHSFDSSDTSLFANREFAASQRWTHLLSRDIMLLIFTEFDCAIDLHPCSLQLSHFALTWALRHRRDDTARPDQSLICTYLKIPIDRIDLG